MMARHCRIARVYRGVEEREDLAGCSKSSFSKAAGNGHFIRGDWDDPYCARPTRVFRGRALREHGDRPSHPGPLFSIPLEIGELVVEVEHIHRQAGAERWPVVLLVDGVVPALDRDG